MGKLYLMCPPPNLKQNMSVQNLVKANLPVVTELPQGLDGEALAARALVHVAQLAGAHLAFLLARADPDKHPAVEVDTEAQQRLNVPPVPESEWSTEKERNSRPTCWRETPDTAAESGQQTRDRTWS